MLQKCYMILVCLMLRVPCCLFCAHFLLHQTPCLWTCIVYPHHGALWCIMASMWGPPKSIQKASPWQKLEITVPFQICRTSPPLLRTSYFRNDISDYYAVITRVVCVVSAEASSVASSTRRPRHLRFTGFFARSIEPTKITIIRDFIWVIFLR